jgi:hypothetical protein
MNAQMNSLYYTPYVIYPGTPEMNVRKQILVYTLEVVCDCTDNSIAVVNLDGDTVLSYIR